MKHRAIVHIILGIAWFIGGCGDTTPEPNDVAADTAQQVDAVDASGCEFSCKDPETGKNKKNLCPAPISEYNCVEGCCEPVFRCETDTDCAERGFAEGHCNDTRYACRCDADTGQCSTWYCLVDSECAEGESCAGGACKPMPAPGELSLRLVTPPTVLTKDATLQLLVEAQSTADPDMVVAADVTWSSSDDSIIAISETGMATGGSTAGAVTITATLSADPSVKATFGLRNEVPVEGGLTVITVVAQTLKAPTGRYAVLSHADGTVLQQGELPANGVIIVPDIEDTLSGDGCDIHLMGENTDWVSFLKVTDSVVFAPMASRVYGKITVNQDGSYNAEATVLAGANVIQGAPDLSMYDKGGEFELSLNSFALSNAIFDFSLEAILGVDVKRYFDPETKLPGVDTKSEATIPGGLTFGFDGPAIPDFYLAAPAGKQMLWTLAGRVEASEVAPFIGDILGAIEGDSIDFGKLVSAIIPLFGSFWSAVTPDLAFSGDGTLLEEPFHPVVRIPMGTEISLMAPPLPKMSDAGWADALFMIPGAFLPNGSMMPLGLSAGADTVDTELSPKDGIADSDIKTPEQDPYLLGTAPLHSGLSGPATRYGLVCVAAAIRTNNDDPRPEGGSAIIARAEAGERMEASPKIGEFLGFPMASSWDPETRTIAIEPLEGADTQRVLFKGKTGAHWTIWLNGATTVVVPNPSEIFPGDDTIVDRTENPQLVLANSFDFMADQTLADLMSPGGATLSELLNVTQRVSFVDIRPVNP